MVNKNINNIILGICILLSAIIISSAMIYTTIYNNKHSNKYDRYEFYMGGSTAITFDKFTGTIYTKQGRINYITGEYVNIIEDFNN